MAMLPPDSCMAAEGCRAAGFPCLQLLPPAALAEVRASSGRRSAPIDCCHCPEVLQEVPSARVAREGCRVGARCSAAPGRP